MPRPKKRRKVFGVPPHRKYGPYQQGSKDVKELIMLSVDEFEAIRLIDYEKHTQQACSQKMDVSRTTVQAIYERARKKLAHSIVEGRPIVIDGGDYVYQAPYHLDKSAETPQTEDESFEPSQPLSKDEDITRIAVSEVEKVVSHFGECETMQIFDVKDNTIIDVKTIERPDIPGGFLPSYLKKHHVDIVIGNDMGRKLQEHFNDEDITVHITEKAYAKDAVSDWILS